MAELIGKLLFEIVGDLARGLVHSVFTGASLTVLSWVAMTLSRRAALIAAFLVGLAAAGFFPMVALLLAKTPG